MSLFIPSEALSRESWLLGEHILEELTNTLDLTTTSLHLRAVSASQVFIVLNGNILEEVLKDLHVLRRLANLNEGSDKHRMIVNLYHIVRAIHINLYLRLLKLLKLILI